MAVKAETVSAKQERAVRAKLSHVVKRHLAEKRLCSTSTFQNYSTKQQNYPWTCGWLSATSAFLCAFWQVI